MVYTDEEIQKYIGILNKYNNSIKEEGETPHQFQCWNCQSVDFFVETGYYICESCGAGNGYVLGYYDLREYDRFHYHRKSICHRKHHCEKKVKEISKRLSLCDEEEYCLYNKLMEIDQETISKLNKHFNRKRMINIFYLIKKCLEEIGCEKYHQVGLKISKQTLENCEKWWECYKSLDVSSDNSLVENPVNNSS